MPATQLTTVVVDSNLRFTPAGFPYQLNQEDHDMGTGRHIRCFDYVNHRYENVRDVLKANTAPVFSRATKGAASRADELASQLRVNVGALEIGTDIDIAVHSVEETQAAGTSSPVTRIQFEWKAKQSPRLFPVMHAELSVYPLTATETQLDFSGHYEPPLGVVGSAVDAVLGNRVADASIHRFLSEVASYLRANVA